MALFMILLPLPIRNDNVHLDHPGQNAARYAGTHFCPADPGRESAAACFAADRRAADRSRYGTGGGTIRWGFVSPLVGTEAGSAWV